MLQQQNNQFQLSWHWVAKAKILAAQEGYEPAIACNEQGRLAPQAVKRQDALFSALLLAPTLAHDAANVDAATATAALTALLPAWSQEDQQAAVYYACWQLDNHNTDARRRATALYERLIAVSPDSTFRTRYSELTGRALPPAPPLPELPPFVAAHASHPDLQQQIDDLIRDPR